MVNPTINMIHNNGILKFELFISNIFNLTTCFSLHIPSPVENFPEAAGGTFAFGRKENNFFPSAQYPKVIIFSPKEASNFFPINGSTDGG